MKPFKSLIGHNLTFLDGAARCLVGSCSTTILFGALSGTVSGFCTDAFSACFGGHSRRRHQSSIGTIERHGWGRICFSEERPMSSDDRQRLVQSCQLDGVADRCVGCIGRIAHLHPRCRWIECLSSVVAFFCLCDRFGLRQLFCCSSAPLKWFPLLVTIVRLYLGEVGVGRFD